MRDLDDYTEKYQNDTFELEYKVPYRRKHILQILEKYNHEEILEIGCGMESLLRSVNHFKSGIIVEPSEIFANRTRDIEGVTVFNACLENCVQELQKRHFDFIVLSALLHEVEKPFAFLRMVHSVCQADTVVHINVPNANSFHRLLGVECNICSDTHDLTEQNLLMQQHTVFDAKSLERLIIDVADADGKSVDICEKGSYFVKPFTNGQMEQCMKSGAITPKIIEGLDRMIKHMPDFGSEIYVNYRLQ